MSCSVAERLRALNEEALVTCSKYQRTSTEKMLRETFKQLLAGFLSQNLPVP